MQQVAVLGLGDFGLSLARQLAKNSVSVLVVDKSREKIELHQNEFHRAVIANFTHPNTLIELGLAVMDSVVLASSKPLETSVLGVLRLKEIKPKRLLVKAEDEVHAKVLEALGVSEIILPNVDIAMRVANTLSWPHVFGMLPILPGYSIMEIAPPEFMLHKKLIDTRIREEHGLSVIAIREFIPPRIEVNPDPERAITDSCALILLGRDEDLKRIQQRE